MIRPTDILIAAAAALVGGLVIWPSISATHALSQTQPPAAAAAVNPQDAARRNNDETPRHDAADRPRSMRERTGDGSTREFGRGWRGGMMRPPTPEQIDRALDVLCEINAEKCEQLKKKRQELTPEQFAEQFRFDGRRLMGLVRLKDTNPDLYTVKIKELKLESQIETMAASVREANRSGSESAAGLDAELRKLVRDQLNLRIYARGQELYLLEQHLDNARQQLRKDASNLDDLLNQRMQALSQPRENRRDADNPES